jgi:hypothetical protein
MPKEDFIGENDFNEWLDSIEFVNSKGKVLPIILTKDESEDPEDDRGQMVFENSPRENPQNLYNHEI